MVQVSSAGVFGGDYAHITINDIPRFVKMNESNNYRGLHIVILDAITGKVVEARVFDTFTSSEPFEKFLAQGFPDGTVFIAACRDECTS